MTKGKGMIEKLFNRWKALSLPAKATICYTVCSIFQKGISFIVVPIFTRVLSTDEYGMYSIYQSVQAVVSIIVTFNLGAATFNVCAKKCSEEERGGMTVSLMGLSTALVVVGGVGWLIINEICSGVLNSLLNLNNSYVLMMFIQTWIGGLTGIWCAGMRYSYSYRPLITYTIILSILNPIVSLFAFKLWGALSSVRIISVTILEVTLGAFVCIIYIRKNRFNSSFEWWGFATRFSLPLIPHYLSMSVLSQANRIMIGSLIGNTAAAIYSVAYNIGIIINFFTTSINSAFIPFIYESMKKKKYSAVKKVSEALLILVGILVICVVALAPEIMHILAPVEYYEAVWIIPPIALSSFFIFTYSLFANIEFYFEKNKYVMIASCLGAAVNIVLNAIFIPKFGYLCAGYITLFCYILFTIAHYLFYKKTLSDAGFKTEIFNLKKIAGLVAFLSISITGLSLCYQIPILRYLVIIGMIAGVVLKKNIILKYVKALNGISEL